MVGCSKFIKDLAPILMLAGLGFSVSASAEGGCPAGSYPIGGQGVQGCAPIPSSGSSSSEGPRPNGRWIKTWGALASAPNGASGASVGGDPSATLRQRQLGYVGPSAVRLILRTTTNAQRFTFQKLAEGGQVLVAR